VDEESCDEPKYPPVLIPPACGDPPLLCDVGTRGPEDDAGTPIDRVLAFLLAELTLSTGWMASYGLAGSALMVAVLPESRT
jgi:hypothetical protein